MRSTRCHTFTGQGFDPFNPRPEDVRIEDIAHHLALTCRYGGAIPVFYSVAQHAVSVSRLVLHASGDPHWALQALHHDSAEAYVGDQIRPIKQLLRYHDTKGEEIASFDALETEVLLAIYEALKINTTPACPSYLIKDADNAMLRAEMRGLLNDEPGPSSHSPITAEIVHPYDCWNWATAEAKFLATNWNLMSQITGRAR